MAAAASNSSENGSRWADVGRWVLATQVVGTTTASALLLAKVGIARRMAVRLLIVGVRSTTLVALAILGRNLWALARTKRSLTLRRALWYALSTWSLAEALFLAYILEYKRRLNSQTTRRWQAVTTHSTEEKRTKSLERYLLSLVQVCQCSGSSGTDMVTKRNGEHLGAVNFKRSLAAPKKALSDHLRFPGGTSSSSLLSMSFSGNSLFRKLPKHEASVDDLLKLWEGHETVTDTELQKLKWLELASFFSGLGRGDAEDITSWLQRGNVEQWVAHYWFRGANPEDLEGRPRERQELGRLVDMVLESAGLMHLPRGRNPRVKCFRIFSDPLPVIHRPLFVYAGTSLLCPLCTLQVMRLMGFHRERVGGLAYWKRDQRKDVQADMDVTGNMPLVFVHGLGVGLVPYYLLIYRLSKRHSGELYVPEFPFLAMAPWESVPSAREVVAQLQDMLAANGHTAAHFMGHSFGAVVIGWVMKMSPSSVIFTTLMEPAAFLMMKSECLSKVLYGPPKTCYEMLIRYCAFRELFTVNLLCRNFFWEQSTMWPEDIHVPAIIELAGSDHIVQSLFVRRLLEHERAARKDRRKRAKRSSTLPISASAVDVRSDREQASRGTDSAIDIVWCEGFLHGEILFRPRAQEKLFSKMRQMRTQLEAVR